MLSGGHCLGKILPRWLLESAVSVTSKYKPTLLSEDVSFNSLGIFSPIQVNSPNRVKV